MLSTMGSPATEGAISGRSHGPDRVETPVLSSANNLEISSIPEQRSDSFIGENTGSGHVRNSSDISPNQSTTQEEQMAQDTSPSIEEVISRFRVTDGGSGAASSSHQGTSSVQQSASTNEQSITFLEALTVLNINSANEDALSTTSSQDFPSPGAYDARFYPPFPGMSDWQTWMRTHPDSDWRVPSVEEYEEWSNSDLDRQPQDSDESGEYTYNRFRVWREAVNFRYKGRASLKKTSSIVNQRERHSNDPGVGSWPLHTPPAIQSEQAQAYSNPWDDSGDRTHALSPTAVHRTSRSSGEDEIYSIGDGPSVTQRESHSGHSSAPMESAYNGRASRPLPVRPRKRSQPREIVIPRWQPDAEVTLCPICRTQFSFFVRKHHCRKCGRVVCSSCSPHRITIPYQYIVQPPEPSMGQASSSIRHTRDHARAGSIADSGGESVRICNPCVPDPNTTPPPQNGHLQLSPSRSRSVSHGVPGSLNASRMLSGTDVITPDMLRTSTGDRPRSHFGSNRSRSSTVGTNNVPNSTSPRPIAQTASSLTPQPPSSRALSPRDEPSNSTLQTPPPRRRRIPEADICPICHTVIPGRTVPNADAIKEAHISNCIDEEIRRFSNRSTAATPTPAQPAAVAAPPTIPPASTRPLPRTPEPGSSSTVSTSTFTSTPNLPPSHSATSTTASASTTTPSTPHTRTLAREQAHAAIVLSSTQPPQSTRRIDSILYTATEKDCVDDAECTICLEEFEVGVRMRRLDCFCRFHMRCIDGWLERNRSCPVHQHGAGF